MSPMQGTSGSQSPLSQLFSSKYGRAPSAEELAWHNQNPSSLRPNNIGVDGGSWPDALGPQVSMAMPGQSQGSLFSSLYGRAAAPEELAWHNANPTALNPNFGAAPTGQPAMPATGAASRSPQGSYWKLPDGRYFVPQVTDHVGGGLDDYAFLNDDMSGGYKAYGTGGTPHTFDNTGNVLPGFKQGPSSLSDIHAILGKGAWSPGAGTGGSLSGTVYNTAPEERAYKNPKEETFMQALAGGDNSPGIWAPSPLGMFLGAAGGVAAGMGAFGGGAGAGAEGATGAFDMGIGGVGESMGLGAGYTSPGAGAFDVGGIGGESWGVNPRGEGMDMPEFDFGGGSDLGGDLGGIDWSDFTDFGSGNTGFGETDALNFANSDIGQLASSTGLGMSDLKSALGALQSATGLTGKDLLSMAGKLGAAGLGALGSSNQSNALADLAKKYQEYGAPSRGRYEASMTPGFDPNSIPGYSGALDSASQAIMRKLSASGGNPFGNPGGLIEANKAIVSGTAMPAIGEYQRLNANTGFGQSMNAALGLQTAGITADRGITTALSSGLENLTAPKTSSWSDLMRSLGIGGLA